MNINPDKDNILRPRYKKSVKKDQRCVGVSEKVSECRKSEINTLLLNKNAHNLKIKNTELTSKQKPKVICKFFNPVL